MRFVFDTNVFVNALLLADSKPRRAVDAALERGTILLSFEVIFELYQVLRRRQFKRYLDEDDVRIFVATLIREAEWIDVDVAITECRDPKDDKFLELAISGRATHIVTGDADLLALNPFRGVRILSPDEALTL